MSNENRAKLLATIDEQLEKMCDPNHPASKLIIERTGFGADANHVPQIAEFLVRIEYVSVVAQLPVKNANSLVLPTNMRKPVTDPIGG